MARSASACHNSRSLVSLAITVAAVVAARGGATCAQCHYEVTVIQAPECGIFGHPATIGTAINELGHVAGYQVSCVGGGDRAFVWTPADGYQLLPLPDGVTSMKVTDLNNHDVVVGTMDVLDLGPRGFVYEMKTGEYTVIPPVNPGSGWSSVSAINSSGVVVGTRSITDDVNPQTAFLWSEEDGFTDIGVLAGPSSAATDVNELGHVTGWTGTGTGVGTVGFLWINGEVTELDVVPEDVGLTSQAFAIAENDVLVGSGEVAVDGYPSGVPRAFRWCSGSFQMLGTLPDHLVSFAHDTNSFGTTVIGQSRFVDGNPNVSHAFIWCAGALSQLDEFLQPDAGIQLYSANAMNSTGRIVTSGFSAVTGRATFLLSPIDQPAADLTGDCRVGFDDLLVLLSTWGICPSGASCPADLDGDSEVGVDDLIALVQEWSD